MTDPWAELDFIYATLSGFARSQPEDLPPFEWNWPALADRFHAAGYEPEEAATLARQARCGYLRLPLPVLVARRQQPSRPHDQVLWRIEARHFITSPMSRPEGPWTVVYQATAGFEIVDPFFLLPGSFCGELDHERALFGLLSWLKELRARAPAEERAPAQARRIPTCGRNSDLRKEIRPAAVLRPGSPRK